MTLWEWATRPDTMASVERVLLGVIGLAGLWVSKRNNRRLRRMERSLNGTPPNIRPKIHPPFRG